MRVSSMRASAAASTTSMKSMRERKLRRVPSGTTHADRLAVARRSASASASASVLRLDASASARSVLARAAAEGQGFDGNGEAGASDSGDSLVDYGTVAAVEEEEEEEEEELTVDYLKVRIPNRFRTWLRAHIVGRLLTDNKPVPWSNLPPPIRLHSVGGTARFSLWDKKGSECEQRSEGTSNTHPEKAHCLPVHFMCTFCNRLQNNTSPLTIPARLHPLPAFLNRLSNRRKLTNSYRSWRRKTRRRRLPSRRM